MIAGTYSRQAALAAWRARVGPSEELCLALFGVGRLTLQRIESGEIAPEPEIGARIDQELELCAIAANFAEGGG